MRWPLVRLVRLIVVVSHSSPKEMRVVSANAICTHSGCRRRRLNTFDLMSNGRLLCINYDPTSGHYDDDGDHDNRAARADRLDGVHDCSQLSIVISAQRDKLRL